MNENNRGIRKFIMYFSLQEREKREYSRYEAERSHYEALTGRELSSKYINAKSKYEYKKNVFTFFMITISLSILTGLTETLYSFFEKIMQFISMEQENSIEIVKINVTISVTVFIIIVVTICILLFSYLKTLYILRKKILIIEEVRKKNDESE